MAPVLDHAHARDFDIAHHVRVAAEDPAVDEVALARAGEDGRIRIQHDPVPCVETGAVRRARLHASVRDSASRNGGDG